VVILPPFPVFKKVLALPQCPCRARFLCYLSEEKHEFKRVCNLNFLASKLHLTACSTPFPLCICQFTKNLHDGATMNTSDHLIFIKDKGVITYQDRVIVDLSNIRHQAKAWAYSGLTSDFQGYETDFLVDDGKKPFQLASLRLSVAAFIQSVVENRLEIDGMFVDDSIIDIYCLLAQSSTLKWPVDGEGGAH
jgi:hypothetical protein